MTIVSNPNAPASDQQVQTLCDLAYTHAGMDWPEIAETLFKFKHATRQQASDLIDAWINSPAIRQMNSVGRIIITPTPAPAPTTAAPPVRTLDPPMTPRLINAKFDSTCPVCHQPIHVGNQIWYKKGFKANHAACGMPTVPTHATTTTPAPTPAPKIPCDQCDQSFATLYERDQHIRDYHFVRCTKCGQRYPTHADLDNHIKMTHPKFTVPMKGRYAVQVPIDGTMTWRFYRVTESRKWTYRDGPEQGNKLRYFKRESSDNLVDVAEVEAAIAAAMINAAPGLAQEAYGKMIGHCGCCGKKLTDPESRARGIGPECLKNYGSRYI